MPHSKNQLQKIIRDLKHFIKITCEYDPKNPKQPHDFVGEKCNDAYFMLQEAHNELAEELAEDLKEKKK